MRPRSLPAPVQLLTALLLAVCCAAPAQGDTWLWRRFKGGPPRFVGGGASPLPAGEQVIIRNRRGYSIGFVPRLRLSLWVAYRLTPGDTRRDLGRSGVFRRDDDLAEAIPPGRYAGSGYDRGHLAPSLDMRYADDVQRQSFWMGNIAPQTPRLNRGRWKTLEAQIHRLAALGVNDEPTAREVHVIAGPIFDKTNLRQTRASQDALPIPKAFYKIYLYNGKAYARLFAQDGLSQRDTTIGEVERLTGLRFLPDMGPAAAILLNMRNGAFPDDDEPDKETE